MNLFRDRKRPVMVIIVGVFFIGIGLAFGLLRPTGQNGVVIPELPEIIIPTPVLNTLPAPNLSVDGHIKPAPTLQSPQVTPPPITIQTQSYRGRAVFGYEPMLNPILEKINDYGREYPVWITIPSIKLSAPVVLSTIRKVLMEETVTDMWFAPDLYAAGWHTSSALPGEIGNTVLSGHNNDYGHVFRELKSLQQGDEIQIITQKRVRNYVVANIVLLQEVEVGLAQRQENARWISPSPDERLTLVTCWPDDSNTHRLIIVASPN